MSKVYSDCSKHPLFETIPDKNKYTKRDVNTLLINSLFQGANTLSEHEAVFMIKCKAYSFDDSKAIPKLSKWIEQY